MNTQRTADLLRLTSVICSSVLALAALQPQQVSMTCRRYVSCVLPALAMAFCTRAVRSNLSLGKLWLSLVNGAEQIATDMWIGGIVNGTLGPLWPALQWPTHSERKYFKSLCYPRSQNVSQIWDWAGDENVDMIVGDMNAMREADIQAPLTHCKAKTRGDDFCWFVRNKLLPAEADTGVVLLSDADISSYITDGPQTLERDDYISLFAGFRNAESCDVLNGNESAWLNQRGADPATTPMGMSVDHAYVSRERFNISAASCPDLEVVYRAVVPMLELSKCVKTKIGVDRKTEKAIMDLQGIDHDGLIVRLKARR